MNDCLIELKNADPDRSLLWGTKWDSVLQNMQDRAAFGGTFRLTNLQRMALEDPFFWGSWEGSLFKGKNLIIQAATSAGKTLLSELAAIDALANQKQVLVLVPFKAMVKERYHHFRDDFSQTRTRVFASSSDYQENDEDLIHGDYDVGILVYEKLFSMLCQPNCRILNNCGLIVVDELTMMAMESRGPKLEVSLQIAMQQAGRALRIICLTTTDCDVKYVRKWLGQSSQEAGEDQSGDVEVLESTTRPVGLDETIITLDDGCCYQQQIPQEEPLTSGAVPAPAPAGEMQQGQFMELRSIPFKARNNAVLRTILRRLAQEHQDQVPRTLIFVPSQNGARRLANGLVQSLGELFPKRELDPEFRQALLECSGDGDTKQILRLAAHGIAYHHASMSSGLREAVENHARCLDVIVATETLTVGVNLPFEAVIITDNKVYRGGSTPVSLTQQEYKNIIGRAGRLGLCDHGQSYLLITSSELDRYTARTRPVPIVSALAGSSDPQSGRCREEELAPYYLPQLMDCDITAQRICAIDKASLSHCCGAKALDPAVMLESLEDCQLVQRDRLKRKPTYQLRQAAKALAPYAFCLDTTWALRMIFGHLDQSTDYPDPLQKVTPAEIRSDRWLPDLLFLVCQNDEIRKGHTLDLVPRAGGDISAFRPKLIKALQALVEDPAEPAQLLPEGSELDRFLSSRPSVETADYVALFRTLAMYYWARGTSFGDLQKKLGLAPRKEDLPEEDAPEEAPLFSIGDLERFAEVCAFQLEAASHLIQDHFLTAQTLAQDPDLSAYQRELYSLSCRVKYGMPRELTLLANRHIQGIDRQMLLELFQRAKKSGRSLIEYLYEASPQERRSVIPDHKYHALTSQLNAVYYAESRRALQRKLAEDPELDPQWVDSLLKLAAEGDGVKASDWFQQLNQVLQDCRRTDGTNPLGLCSIIQPHKAKYHRWLFQSIGLKNSVVIKDLHIAFLPREQVSTVTDLSLNDYFDPEIPLEQRLLIIPSAAFQEESWPLQKQLEQQRAAKGGTAALGCGRILSSMALIGLLCSHVTMKDNQAANLLYQTLTDLRGYSRSVIDRKADNYRPAEPTCKEPRYQILLDWDNAPDQLLALLTADPELRSYRLLPWGSALQTAADPNLPTVILLDSATLESRQSLYNFLYHQGHNPALSFLNCLVLLDSQQALRAWNAPHGAGLGMRWEENNRNAYPEVCPSAQEKFWAIRQFLAKWKPASYRVAISYAHYDDQGRYQPGQADKIQWLAPFVDALNQEFGEDQVLFDHNRRASGLFCGQQETALAAYREASVGIVLYDNYYLANHYCRQELDALRQGNASQDLFYLQCGAVQGNAAQVLGNVTSSYCPSTPEAIQDLIRQIFQRMRGVS